MASMWEGQVRELYVSPDSGGPNASTEAVEAVAGQGLEGDRNLASDGARAGRAVTLIESEAVAAVEAESDLTLTAEETRRNIVTEGVPLNHLVDREFTVGETVLRGVRLCEPCVSLEESTRPGVRMALLHRGGLRADIVEGGTIRVGDRIAPG